MRDHRAASHDLEAKALVVAHQALVLLERQQAHGRHARMRETCLSPLGSGPARSHSAGTREYRQHVRRGGCSRCGHQERKWRTMSFVSLLARWNPFQDGQLVGKKVVDATRPLTGLRDRDAPVSIVPKGRGIEAPALDDDVFEWSIGEEPAVEDLNVTVPAISDSLASTLASSGRPARTDHCIADTQVASTTVSMIPANRQSNGPIAALRPRWRYRSPSSLELQASRLDASHVTILFQPGRKTSV